LLVTLSLVGGLLSIATQASAVGSVTVSLAFDDNTTSEYTQAYLQALQPHNVHATFFVKSGSVGAGGTNMTWTQVTTLAGDGNDIGGKTVSATNLVGDPNAATQVCQDRQNLISHGLTPIAFAYPGGAGFSDATVRGVVQSCGYGNARRAGGLSPTSSTNFAETLPPVDPLAIRVYLPPSPAGGVQLTDLQAIVNNAYTRGGGWVPVVLPSKVCPTQADPGYAGCATGTFVGVDVLNQFLTWVQGAGQAGQAPAGTSFDTAAHVLTTSDTSTPTTGITCNGSACSSDPYPGVVSVTLPATDLGSGLASTHYTTDGSDPTPSSPTYAGAFNVNGNSSSTTVKFRSWDYAGNVEPTKTQIINAPPDTIPPTTTIACNGSTCSASPYVDSVTVTLSPADTGGSGVDKTYYTTDGSTPTTSSTVYSGAFQLSQPGTSTVNFFSTDTAGNAEAVQSQQIQVVPAGTSVSLTFDNNSVGQYTLAFQQALQPHNAHATFFVNSGTVGTTAGTLTWNQVSNLAAAGNDIGGKTVNATNLKTDPDPVTQVCQDRQNLISNGLNPIAFAYPGGAFDPAVKGIVQNCGYGNARSAGSLSPNGPTYAETVPPKDWLATRAYPGVGSPAVVTLADMESIVTGAASHGGGWVQLVMTRVCSQSLDASNYSSCLAASGHVELADLVSFLDWIQNAGQAGGAPAGTSLQTVRDVVTAADISAPTTASSCDVGPCSGSYDSVVKVTLSPTDLGTGISSTHYTIDGTTPTQSSPTYTRRIAITSPTTLHFRSWDNAGNVEAVQSLSIQSTPPPDSSPPTTTITCDDGPCSGNAYDGQVTVELTASDGSGWGIDNTYYTTDGSTPDQNSAVYTGAFQLFAGDHTIRFFSTDIAGNTEPPNAQLIQVTAAETTVSVTFDDGDLSQFALAFQRGLQPRNMRGTFFITTGDVEGGPGFVTWSDVSTLAANGQDVGGHTVHHIDLTSSSYTQQQKIDEVCDGRQALIDHGLSPVSFAYPFGAYDANAKTIVQNCGYTSARRTGGITASPPPYAETIPPSDPFATRTWTAPTPTDAPIQLSDMEAVVTAAATHGGGWVQIVIHQVCSQTYDAANYTSCLGSFRPMELDTFTAFLDWMQNSGQAGGAPAGTVVKSVSQVMAGPDTIPPVTTIACDGSPCQGTYTGSVSVGLAATDTGGSGVDKTYYTTDGSTPTTSSPTYSGPFSLTQTTTVRFFSADIAGNAETAQSQQIDVQALDTTPPATTIACDAAPCSSGWYASAPVSVSLSATDAGSGVDATYYTTDGSTPTTSSTIYTGAFGVTQTTSVKFFSRDNEGNAEQVQSQLIQIDGVPPVTTIVCNGASCGSGVFNKGPVKITLPASDSGGSGLDKTYYTTDGSTPTTSSTVYVGQFSLTKTTTIRSFSTDKAGNAEPPKSQQVTLDSAAPTTAISCNAAACSSGWYTASSVLLSLFPSDTGGSGVAKTYYTTDGSTPTTASPVYAGAFTIAQTTTVKFFSVDNAGNKESVKTSTVRLDAVAPSISLTAPTNGQSFKKGAKVSLSATSSDAGTGTGAPSGVAKVVFYLDSDILSTDTSSPFTATWNTSRATVGSHTITAIATDAAGNSTTSSVINVTITN
jgi:peptidoglycan/xylan/chitin deacetylase (PgdA/CDA1 family)